MNSKLAKKLALFTVLAVVILAAAIYGKQQYDDHCFWKEAFATRSILYGYNPVCIKTTTDGVPKCKVYVSYYRDWKPDPDLPEDSRYLRFLYAQYQRGY